MKKEKTSVGLLVNNKIRLLWTAKWISITYEKRVGPNKMYRPTLVRINLIVFYPLGWDV